jgi:hypothetical protein
MILRFTSQAMVRVRPRPTIFAAFDLRLKVRVLLL